MTHAINDNLNIGDYVIVTPDTYCGCLLGQVTAIDKIGSPEHDTDNDTDDVHVNFRVFHYPPYQQNNLEKYFEKLSGGNYVPFNDLSLDDVILAPDTLISLTGVPEKKVAHLVKNYHAAKEFCNQILLTLESKTPDSGQKAERSSSLIKQSALKQLADAGVSADIYNSQRVQNLEHTTTKHKEIE